MSSRPSAKSDRTPVSRGGSVQAGSPLVLIDARTLGRDTRVMLNLQHIRDRLGPDFQPFTIRVSEGRSFEVPHRDFIAVGRGIVLLVNAEDRSHIIDALHIVSVDGAERFGQNGG